MEEHTQPLSKIEIINAAQSRDFSKIRSLRQTDKSVVTNTDEKGYSAFHWAAISDDVEVFNALAEGNEEYAWECRTSIGLTALHVACANSSVHIVRRMVEILKANPSFSTHINDQNAFKETPLHVAAMINDIEIAQILLAGGADVSVLDKWNQTARRIAMENGDTVLAALLPAHANDDLESRKPVDAASAARRVASSTSAVERTRASEESVADAAASMLSYRKEAPQKWNFNAVTNDVLEALKSGKDQSAAAADKSDSASSASIHSAITGSPSAGPSTSLHQSVLASSPGDSYINSLPRHQTQPPPESALAPAHLKLLHKLSQLANIGPERLAYEIVLNPYYRLPTPAVLPSSTEGMSPGGPLQRSNSASSIPTPSISNSVVAGPPTLQRDTSNQTLSSALSAQDPATWMDSLRRQMLRVMGDKMINSLRRSPVVNASEVAVGQVVPLYFMPNDASPEQATAGTGSGFFTYTKTPVLSARVLALRRAGDVSALDLSTSLHSGEPTSSDEVVSLDVQYLGDGVREDNVSLKRVVLSGSYVPDPTPLVMALQDLAMQIASFTPNRLDIQQAVLTTVDAALLSQMIVNRALDPVTDLLPILHFFQRSLMDLQAPSRTASTEAWMRQLAESFHKVEPATGSPNTVPSSGQRRGKSIDEVAHLLPPFFERANSVVEEIQRDMANYYITVLVPVLHQKGHAYLRDMFQAGIQEGAISLDGTASLLFAQLLPNENFQATVKDLVEAGACAETGFVLEDILPSAAENAPRMLNGAVVKPTSAASPASDDADSAAPVNVPVRSNLVDGIVARSMVYLMQLPVRLDTPEALWVLPETLMWDAGRLATMRDLVDRIALECSLVIATKQVIGRYQLPAWCSDPHAEVELQHRLDVLLSEKDTSLASITVEVSRYVQEALHKFREAHATAVLTRGTGVAVGVTTGVNMAALATVPNTHPALIGGDAQEVHERVTKALKDVVAEGNPVLALFSKRVYKVLLRAMLGKEYKHLLPSYSLSSPAQQRNLSQLLLSASRLFSHTMGVHRDIYTVVLGRAVATATAPAAGADSA